MSPKSFRSQIRSSIADRNLQIALDANAERRTQGRLAAFASLPDYQERRARAHAVKTDVIARLDEYLERFVARVTANGIQVQRAADGDEAVRLVIEIVEKQRTKNEKSSHPALIAKSKSMVSEEINLNHALAEHGVRAVETDLGEYIVQLRGERPSHILTPAVHLRRGQVGQLFHEKLGIPYTEDIPTLTATARKVLREVFLTADVGLSGVNFGVVETGTLCLVTNEGNGRMVTSVPPIHIALMGIERLAPTLDDLALFLSLLPRSGTGQKLSVYTSLIHSPRRPGDMDGPRERHLVLVDNGRTRLRNSDLAESLYCIRCGACLNACPVFREIGGHAYRGADGSIAPYPGPIGSVISPGLFGLEQFGQLAQASSLCGACKEACPVDIDLPGMLLRVRAGGERKNKNEKRNEKQKEGVGLQAAVKLGLRAYRLVAWTPGLFAAAQRLGGFFSRLYSPRSSYMHVPAFTGWGYSKDFPRFAAQAFRRRWNGMHQERAETAGQVQPAPTPAGYEASAGSLADRFCAELAAVGGKTYRVSGQELPARLAEFLKSRGVERVCVDETGARNVPETVTVRNPDPASPPGTGPAVQAGITGVLAGIAESGTLVLVGGPGRPLTASLLPEIHVALLREKDIYAGLPQVLNLPEVRKAPAAVLVTGPSRTADIEMALTIGVHGPKEVHVFLIGESGTVG